MADPRPLLLRGGRIVDGQGSAPAGGRSVLIEGGRIAAVEPDAALQGHSADVLDLGGRTVLPGLIDAHAHISGVRLPGDDRRPWQLSDSEMDAALDDVAGSLLAGGVTTVRDLGAFGTSVLRLRDRIAAGAVAGPRILASGLIISAVCPGAKTFPGMYLESTGPDTFRAAVRRVVGDDADVIKIMATGAFTVADEDIDPPQMSLEELRAAVHEGHRLGRRVAVHAEGLAGVRLAVQAGADTIEHAETAHRDPGVLEAMARERIILVPTLSAFEGVAANPVYADWMRERSAALSAEAGATVAAARAAGVRIAVGPDSGPQGQNGQEVARLVAAGLTPLEAIAAGTSIAAEACGLGDRTGRIAPRFDADLIVVDGDPIAAPELLAGNPGPWLVILGGKVVAGSSQGAARLPHM